MRNVNQLDRKIISIYLEELNVRGSYRERVVASFLMVNSVGLLLVKLRTLLYTSQLDN